MKSPRAATEADVPSLSRTRACLSVCERSIHPIVAPDEEDTRLTEQLRRSARGQKLEGSNHNVSKSCPCLISHFSTAKKMTSELAGKIASVPAPQSF